MRTIIVTGQYKKDLLNIITIYLTFDALGRLYSQLIKM